MNGSSKGWLRAPRAVSILVLCGAPVACTGELAGTSPGRVGTEGQAGSGGAGGATVTPQEGCDGNEVAMPRRLIRLSFNQIAGSLRPIFGDAFADKVVADNRIGPATTRTFPPLGDTAEGTAYIDARWQPSRRNASRWAPAACAFRAGARPASLAKLPTPVANDFGRAAARTLFATGFTRAASRSL